MGELDTTTGAGIFVVLRGIANADTTVVIATHDPAAIDYVDTANFVESGTLRLPVRDERGLWLTEGREFSGCVALRATFWVAPLGAVCRQP
jgi:ABC-type lipoprotein export system ATPase subunit